ncbi:DNA polymerase Y family protein [Aquisalimonas lutea]|uniref:Y-family DNA polymerase n=1 Tax=Aquisalimonas lutea TaxID=1327750 RepID=UPI0025B340D6|nr:DNA polymerase Y family protein [Aquisalimonas lutea]MDN3518825.1 DNA polymerase Y family protein [Aquisalimonas lutea]
MLWLALYLPELPLEAPGCSSPGQGALAVTEHQRILRGNAAAAAGGVHSGQTPSEARALMPELQLLPRQRQEEARCLRHLADWGYQFSNHVSPRTPDGLLLEIGASLRLFGGLPALLGHLAEAFDGFGHSYCRGIAPTPTAAWLLARAGDSSPVETPRALRERLAQLPCHVLELLPGQLHALQGLGLHTLADCLQLPRRDLARRFGRPLLLQLEHALGERPDPRPAHQPASRFDRYLELPAEAGDIQSLGFALQRILRELAGLLRAREGGVQKLALELHHRRQAPTCLEIGLLRPGRDPEHLLTLCQHRLEREPLAAPVTALQLRAGHILPLPPEPVPLLPHAEQAPAEKQAHLSERLQARLGEHAVTGLDTVADHRPERAWCPQTGTSFTTQAAPGERPAWLLPHPQPLDWHQGHPFWHGPLRLECGPERIETGWWDGDDISRDYYQARNPRGSRVWVFRERRGARRWFLHGFFA